MHGFVWIISQVKNHVKQTISYGEVGKVRKRSVIACAGSSRVLDVEFRVATFELLASSLTGNLCLELQLSAARPTFWRHHVGILDVYNTSFDRLKFPFRLFNAKREDIIVGFGE